jgi:ubiquinol-cytochrome c reductase cytochrome b subunit
MVMYRIRNKSHLKEIVIPIFDTYPLFTNKQFDYIRFRSNLLGGTMYSKDLLPYVRPKLILNTVEKIINTNYFLA